LNPILPSECLAVPQIIALVNMLHKLAESVETVRELSTAVAQQEKEQQAEKEQQEQAQKEQQQAGGPAGGGNSKA
jgi:hypothetical protein